MSYFDNNKLFLDLNYELYDTPRTFGLSGITLDKTVATKFNLSSIRAVFVKNKIVQTNENVYFTNSMDTPGYNILNTNLNTSADSAFVDSLQKENSDYEVNKIIKYSNVPGENLIFNHDFDLSNFINITTGEINESIGEIDWSRSSYALMFSDDTNESSIWNKIFSFYRETDPDEDFKFFLVAYDINKNVIDSTNIITLKDKNCNSIIKIEYDELIEGMKFRLKESVDIVWTESGFLVKNYIGDFRDEEANKRRHDIDPLVDPVPFMFRTLNTYPNLNHAFINYVKYEANDENHSLAWIFGGEAELTDNVGFSLDGIIDDAELARFNIYRNSNAKIKVKYISSDSRDNPSNLMFDLENNQTWEQSFDLISQGNIELKKILLRDYNLDNKDTFVFKIEVPYKLQSYLREWDTNFSLVTEIELSRNDVSESLVTNILHDLLRKEIDTYFNIRIVTRRRNSSLLSREVSGEILRLQVEKISGRRYENTIFLGVERNQSPLITDIKQVLNSDLSSVSTLTDYKVFLNESLDESNVRYLGTNTYLKEFPGFVFFELLNKQTDTVEIFGEISLEIKAYYRGREVIYNYFLDVPNGIYLNEDSHINQLLPDSGLASIDFALFEEYETNKVIDFNIKINKQKADDLSNILEFGNKAITPDTNDTDSPAFLERLLFEINHVKHIFQISTTDNAFPSPITIIKSDQSLQNFYRFKDQFVETDNFYVMENILADEESDLRLNSRDTFNFGPEASSIITNFIANNRDNLLNMPNLNEVRYYLEVSYRNFILPKGLNTYYNNNGSGDLSSITYNNINTETYNQNIPNNDKYRMFNFAYEANPSSNNHEEIVTTWFSRRFNYNIDTYKEKCKIVKDYFMGRQYLVSQSSALSMDEEDFKQFRISIGNNVVNYNRNADYEINHEDNSTFRADITIESNIKNFISADTTMGSGKIQMALRPGNTADVNKSTITLKSNNNLNWESSEISNIEVAFIPQILNRNMKQSIRRMQSNNELSDNRILNDAINIGSDTGIEGNIVLKTNYISGCNYSIKNNKKDLEIVLLTSPKTDAEKRMSPEFRLSKYLNRCINHSSGFVANSSLLSTSGLLQSNAYLGAIPKVFPKDLDTKTCIVRNFIYRVKITFTNNNIYYKNFIVPIATSSVANKDKLDYINRDPFRREMIVNYYKLKNNVTSIPGSVTGLLNRGFAPTGDNGENEMFYNLAFMPYNTQLIISNVYMLFNRAKIISIPGYKINTTGHT